MRGAPPFPHPHTPWSGFQRTASLTSALPDQETLWRLLWLRMGTQGWGTPTFPCGSSGERRLPGPRGIPLKLLRQAFATVAAPRHGVLFVRGSEEKVVGNPTVGRGC